MIHDGLTWYQGIYEYSEYESCEWLDFVILSTAVEKCSPPKEIILPF